MEGIDGGVIRARPCDCWGVSVVGRDEQAS